MARVLRTRGSTGLGCGRVKVREERGLPAGKAGDSRPFPGKNLGQPALSTRHRTAQDRVGSPGFGNGGSSRFSRFCLRLLFAKNGFPGGLEAPRARGKYRLSFNDIGTDYKARRGGVVSVYGIGFLVQFFILRGGGAGRGRGPSRGSVRGPGGPPHKVSPVLPQRRNLSHHGSIIT